MRLIPWGDATGGSQCKLCLYVTGCDGSQCGGFWLGTPDGSANGAGRGDIEPDRGGGDRFLLLDEVLKGGEKEGFYTVVTLRCPRSCCNGGDLGDFSNKFGPRTS